MPTIDDTLRSGDDSSRISSGRDRASAAPSRPLLPRLPAQQKAMKKPAAAADHDDFSGLSAGSRCGELRDDRRSGEPADGAARLGNRHPLADRPPPDRAARVPQCLARARRGNAPESRKPAAHGMWPRVFAYIVRRRFPKTPLPRVGGTGFEPVTSTV